MARLTPADLSAFLEIARARSFRRAATALGVSPSALSHSLRSLEERLDVRLFNRTTRSVALTEAGERLFARVQPAYADIEEALDDLASFRGAPMGALRINTAPSVAHLVVMPLLRGFLKAHPAVSVEVIAQTALVDVVAQGFDAGIRFGERVAADVIAVPIGPRQRFVTVASPAFWKAHAKPQHPNELMSLPCVRYRFEGGTHYHWEFERGGTELEIAVQGPFVTNAQELMIEAALDGIGIAFVLEGLVSEHLRKKRLISVLDDWCPYYPGLFLYYPSRRQMPTALRAFIDYLRANPIPADERA